MEAYAQVLSYAIPGFFVLIIIEALVGYAHGKTVYHGMDLISSLSSGVTNTVKSVLGLTVVIVSYAWLEGHFGVFDIQSPLWLYVLAFIGLDFAGYWSHRFNHHVNLFWNRHIEHHSSEEYNLACALRQSISEWFGIYFFLLVPLAIIGIPPEVVAVTAPIHLFAQFWYHTRLIDKMGILEYILVTPSHHRVHHAINDEYLDRNFSTIFIIWDKWFGTFQEELPDVPAVYGTKTPVKTWNPILINYQHVYRLWRDAWHTQRWWDKLRIWFMPTGWRPADVAQRFPIASIEDVRQQKKYRPQLSRRSTVYAWIQFSTTIFVAILYLINIGDIDLFWVYWIGATFIVSVFSYTSIMDQQTMMGLVSGIIFAALGIVALQGLQADSLIGALGFGFGVAYLLSSCAAVLWIHLLEKDRANRPSAIQHT